MAACSTTVATSAFESNAESSLLRKVSNDGCHAHACVVLGRFAHVLDMPTTSVGMAPGSCSRPAYLKPTWYHATIRGVVNADGLHKTRLSGVSLRFTELL